LPATCKITTICIRYLLKTPKIVIKKIYQDALFASFNILSVVCIFDKHIIMYAQVHKICIAACMLP
jgi:hypothetical protein